MACVDGFLKHSWGGGDECQREGCNARKGDAVDETKVNGSGGMFSESLDDIKQDVTGTAVTGDAQKQNKWAARKAKKVLQEREEKELARMKGENLARGIHTLQGFLASQAYSFDSSHFSLSPQEVRSLGGAYGEVLDAFGIEFDSKWAALFMLLSAEFAISKRQWEAAASMYYEQHPVEEVAETVQ
jgi:hypothetical protein